METFRKVSVKERLPEKLGTYITDLDRVTYQEVFGKKCWWDGETDLPVNWWLEELPAEQPTSSVLPSDGEINEIAIEKVKNGDYLGDNCFEGFELGMIGMRYIASQLLAKEKAEAEKNAIEFTEWVDKNEYKQLFINEWSNGVSQPEKTTQELYQLYQTEKEKQK